MGEYIDKIQAAKIIGCSVSWFDSARSGNIKYETDTSKAIKNLAYDRRKTAGTYKFMYLKSDVEKLAEEHPFTRRKGGVTKAYIAKKNNYISKALSRWREITGYKKIYPIDAPECDRELHLYLLDVCLEEVKGI